MAHTQIKDLLFMRNEIERLRKERDDLVRIAGAALVLVNDLDTDTFESYEAAELVTEYLNHLPETLLQEAMGYVYA